MTGPSHDIFYVGNSYFVKQVRAQTPTELRMQAENQRAAAQLLADVAAERAARIIQPGAQATTRSASAERARFRELAQADRLGFSEAVHEAGHFVCAFAAGLAVEYLSLFADDPRRAGECSLAASSRATDERRLLMISGGVAAEIELLGVPRHEYLLSGAGDLRIAASLLDDVPWPRTAQCVFHSRTFTPIFFLARDLIVAVADSTRLVAAALATQRRLTGARCERIFRDGLAMFGESLEAANA